MIKVTVNYSSSLRKLKDYERKIKSATQEGLNYAVEKYLREVKPPYDLGNLQNSYYIAAKNSTGLVSSPSPFVPTRKKHDFDRLQNDYIGKANEYQGRAEAHVEPTTYLVYTAFYSQYHGDEWYTAPISSAVRAAVDEVSGQVRKIQ